MCLSVRKGQAIKIDVCRIISVRALIPEKCVFLSVTGRRKPQTDSNFLKQTRNIQGMGIK